MILFDNGLISLRYDPASDILFVEMPTVDAISIAQVDSALAIVVDHIRNYDVKKLLIDARKTEVAVNEESYTSLIAQFSKGLTSTRVQKIARVVAYSAIRENVVRKLSDENTDHSNHFQSFSEIEPAIAWLNS